MQTDHAAPEPEIAASPAVERLLGLLASGKPRILVALAGLPGAGKSTWAARWAEGVDRRVGAGQLQVLGMDGFHLPRAALARMPDPALALARRGAPWTFDAAALRERLLALRDGSQAVSWPDFQHDVGDPVEGVFVVPPATRLVLVEGLYLLHQGWELEGVFDERWFLDVAPVVARGRLVERHQRAWGISGVEAEARIDVNDGLNSALVRADRSLADRLVPEQ